MVRLLLDQMLPARLGASLSGPFEEVLHVRPLDLGTATDAEVRRYAREQALTIVTKDADFQTLLALHGPPPRVIWLRLGNATSAAMESCLRGHAETIREFHATDAACLVIRERAEPIDT